MFKVNDKNTNLEQINVSWKDQATNLAFVTWFKSKLNPSVFSPNAGKCGNNVDQSNFLRSATIPDQIYTRNNAATLCSDTERKLLSLPTDFSGLVVPYYFKQNHLLFYFFEQTKIEYNKLKKTKTSTDNSG